MTAGAAYGPNPVSRDTVQAVVGDYTVLSEDTPNYVEPTVQFTSAECLRALVFAQGQPALAAERLGLPSGEILLATIVMDEGAHDQLRSTLRMFQTVKLLAAAGDVLDEMMGNLDKMEPKDLGRVYIGMVQAAELMTKTPPVSSGTTNNNLFMNLPGELYRQIPENVRRAIDTLMQAGAESGSEAALPAGGA